MSQIIDPICPTDCSSSVPDVEFNECAPEINAGEITKLYVGAADADCFDEVTDLAEWTTRLDPATGDLKELTVYGEMPEAEANEQKISGDRFIVSQKNHSLVLDVDETNDTNYEFHRKLECNLYFKIWWETAGGKLYGGNCGVNVTLRSNFMTPKERTEIEKIMLTAKWSKKFSPERTDSPLI
jgi:hypothetical protein